MQNVILPNTFKNKKNINDAYVIKIVNKVIDRQICFANAFRDSVVKF